MSWIFFSRSSALMARLGLAFCEALLLAGVGVVGVGGEGGVDLVLAHEGLGGIGLDALGVLKDKEDCDGIGDDEQDEAKADDDRLVDLDAHVGERGARDAGGEGVHRGAEAADASAEQDDHGAAEGVVPCGDHGGGEQGVEADGLLAHAVGGAAEGKDRHEDGDELQLVAVHLRDEDVDAGRKGVGLVHDAEEATEDHDEEADVDGVLEAVDGRHGEAAERGAGDGPLDVLIVERGSVQENRDDCHEGQQNEDDRERREHLPLLLRLRCRIRHDRNSFRREAPLNFTASV